MQPWNLSKTECKFTKMSKSLPTNDSCFKNLNSAGGDQVRMQHQALYLKDQSKHGPPYGHINIKSFWNFITNKQRERQLCPDIYADLRQSVTSSCLRQANKNGVPPAP